MVKQHIKKQVIISTETEVFLYIIDKNYNQNYCRKIEILLF